MRNTAPQAISNRAPATLFDGSEMSGPPWSSLNVQVDRRQFRS